MQIKIRFLVIFGFMFSSLVNEANAQLALPTTDTLMMSTVPTIDYEVKYPDLNKEILNRSVQSNIFQFSKDHVYTQYGFFCKEEAKRDKKTTVPVRFRLGTLQEVNRKEYGY